MALDGKRNRSKTTLSHDPDVVKAYIEDPLVHNKVSARFFTEIHFSDR